jgi:hypothetical protein
MSTKTVDENGYIRVTSDDGRTSRLYEPSSSLSEAFLMGHGRCIEVAVHHTDGTTTAYEYGGGLVNEILNDGRGAPK